jgi:FkbM family methyltransferase
MKSALRYLSGVFGYEIRKAPTPGFSPLPVFDLAVHYLLSAIGHDLTFIQIGANDGMRFGDPLRKYILRYDWAGVLVEPQPDVFETLRKNYASVNRRIHFENAAVSRDPNPIRLYRLPKDFPADAEQRAFASSVVSPNRAITARQLSLRPEQLEELLVPTVRLDDLVTRYDLHDLTILQIDTEGFDFEVLQTLDLASTRPRVIQFEHGHLTPQVIAAMTKHLNASGYLVYFGGHESDSVAMRDDVLPALSR